MNQHKADIRNGESKQNANTLVERFLAQSTQLETFVSIFYQYLRSENVKFIDSVLQKWPDTHSKELEHIFTTAYHKLNLKNVPLNDDTRIFVERKLMDLRFFSEDIIQNDYSIDDIKQRIDLVVVNTTLLNNQCSKEVDEKFIVIAKFIACNIHVLKRQLKSTYKILPWEEIEFCLVSFLSSHIKKREISIFCSRSLNKHKILEYLRIFVLKLAEIRDMCWDIAKLAVLPNSRRDIIVEQIINDSPQFKELYKDYEVIRDAHSLDKMIQYVRLALSARCDDREGRLLMMRALQVVGENLKNTLESPKLSTMTSDIILMSIPMNTRKIVANLRNSLSHAQSLSRRTEIEDDGDVNFFKGLQSDIKKIGTVLDKILSDNKTKTLEIFLKKIIDSKTTDDIKEISEMLENVKLDGDERCLKSIQTTRLERIVTELKKETIEKTSCEDLIRQIEKQLSEVNPLDYVMCFKILEHMFFLLNDCKPDQNVIRGIKFRARKCLEILTPESESDSLKQISKLMTKVSERIVANQDKMTGLIYEMFPINESVKITRIEKLREKMNKRSFSNIFRKKNSHLLDVKLSVLKDVLTKYKTDVDVVESRKDRKLGAVVEMLLLDVLSILNEENRLVNDSFLVDTKVPILIGKGLRNHLAHDNVLFDVFVPDLPATILLNARKLLIENITRSKKKIGHSVQLNLLDLKRRLEVDLIDIENQRNMFKSFEEGKMENAEVCLKNGADIKGRDTNSWTSLHFAAKGSEIEPAKFLLDHNLDVSAKDTNGQTPLHVAVKYGKENVAELFVRYTDLNVDIADYMGKTSLHLASRYGNTAVVDVLLKNNASVLCYDHCGLLPINYAVRHGHIDVVTLFLGENTDIDEVTNGFSLLHQAAEFGHQNIVGCLIENKSNVNVINDNNWTPLHAASLNGYDQIVKILIEEGADVNIRVVNGCTALYYAVENSHEEIVDILLRRGADVNIADKTYKVTPLHLSAEQGYIGIVQILLKARAKADLKTNQGQTPLHLAAKYGHLDIVRLLLKHGVDIDARDINNCSALHLSSCMGDAEVVQLLIDHNAGLDDSSRNNMTALHLAVSEGNRDVVDLLLRNGADVHGRQVNGHTPLHTAAEMGCNDVIHILIKNEALVNSRDELGMTPLHMAAKNGHAPIIDSLIKQEAEVNCRADHGITPLLVAITKGHADCVQILLENNAEIHCGADESLNPLVAAVLADNLQIIQLLIDEVADTMIWSQYQTLLFQAITNNNIEIVQFLIEHEARFNKSDVNAASVTNIDLKKVEGMSKISESVLPEIQSGRETLHFAAMLGRDEIVKLLIAKGVSANAVVTGGLTAAHLAAVNDHSETTEVLLTYGVNVDQQCDDGLTSLHLAISEGHEDVVNVLLNYKASVDIKDNKNRTAVELAVAHGPLSLVKMLLPHSRRCLNDKGHDGWTPLHIASQGNQIDIVKYLVNYGSDLNVRNNSGSKPIHIAAREGFKEAVLFYLSRGMSIADTGAGGQTSLHYASINGHLPIVKHLIDKGADVNSRDDNLSTPLHIAALFGHRNVVRILLKNGATYNVVDMFYRNPVDITNEKDIKSMLLATDRLFEAVRNNNSGEVEKCIKRGTSPNTFRCSDETPLHHASWKGYETVVNVLLENEANPNLVCKKRLTPLHYAAKYSHKNVVKMLLSSGAIYNALSISRKTPLDFSTDVDIIDLLNLIDKSFKKVLNGETRIINDLNRIKEAATVRSVMGACGRDNKTLTVTAIHNDFPKVDGLNQVLQDDVSTYLSMADLLFDKGDYLNAFNIYNEVFQRRKLVLGLDNPGTLDIEVKIAVVIYKQGHYQEALNKLEKIYEKQKNAVGPNYQGSLTTRSAIALILHRLQRNDEAFDIYQETVKKQKELLGETSPDTVKTEFHMALVLEAQRKHDEALFVNRAVLEKVQSTNLGQSFTARVLNNIGMVLKNQGKLEEAMEIYQDVLKKKKQLLGKNHPDTIRTLYHISVIYMEQRKYQKCLKIQEEILDIQKRIMGRYHPETLQTQRGIGTTFLLQGRWIASLKTFLECLEPLKGALGPTHVHVLDITMKINLIKHKFKCDGSNISEILQFLQKDINIAASDGDIVAVKRLLSGGADVNIRDIHGRTPLHFAVANGQVNIVHLLLQNGNDIAQVTNKGNTPLHMAVSKNDINITEILLMQVDRGRMHEFINSKTLGEGSTALHVAARNDNISIVRLLLKYGASYNIEDKNGKTPADVSNSEIAKTLFTMIEDYFIEVKNGNAVVLKKLKRLKVDDLHVVTNARNKDGRTLFQIAAIYKHKAITSKFLEITKNQIQERKKTHKFSLGQIDDLKYKAEVHIRFASMYIQNLILMIVPRYSSENISWKILKDGSYYLRNAYDLVEQYKLYSCGSIDNKEIQSVNDVLTSLGFHPNHISSGFTSDAYDGKLKCFVSKGGGTRYYKLLYNSSQEDITTFVKIVQSGIDERIKRFLNSIKQEIEVVMSVN